MKNRMKFLPIIFGAGALLLGSGLLMTSCAKKETRTPVEILKDSLQLRGDSILMQKDSTAIVHIEKNGNDYLLKSSGIGVGNSTLLGTMNEFVVNGERIIIVSNEGDKKIVKGIDLKTLAIDTIGSPAEAVSFTPAKDSLVYTINGKERKSDLTGKFDLEKEPGVCAAVVKESKRANNYTEGGWLWLMMYQKPIKFLGKSGKLSSWYDGKFKGMIETPDGVIAIKNNGDTYLNDEKIGNTKVSISDKMDSMGFCTYTLVGKFNGENGETDSFSASNRIFIP